ncbi:cytochrome c biogenesis protein CcsA [Thalassotalea sp. LPB0316]|uniref:cytochrome C assembly family protein n=1 Tax=Thalassotalea sp. LPB0316 TaxID=2769490 RepID=UPI001868588A|nr:cytochrome c biogenesis protein CcsA [Thalassotalea sp. LPB0316]QOL26886.1 cytochrome c biogenesis protein CcsA [Thalassotalea sp. LPB0316]
MDSSAIFAISAFSCYLIAAVAVIARLFHPKGPNLRFVLSFASIAIALHAIGLSERLFINSEVNFNLPNVIALVSLVISAVVSIGATRYKLNLLLPVSYIFAGLWQLSLVLLPVSEAISLSASKMALVSHITLALVAYCILVIANLYAFQVSYINQKLKTKNLAAVNHLPPLMQVENQLFMILATGTLCLLISDITGFIFLDSFFAKEYAHKTVLSLVALVLYSVTLWGHFKLGWRGHRVLLLITSATVILTLSYFGSRFVKEFLIA